MAKRDTWARRAHDAGYRSRAAFKLRQLDEEFDLLERGDTVIDLGGAPGGWLQVAVEAVGGEGHVIGVDRRHIEPVTDANARVDTIQGDLTESATIDRLREVIEAEADLVLSDMAPNMSGDYDLDHARSIHLAQIADEVAETLLATGGTLVIKVFDGRDLESLRGDLDERFRYVATARPPASRDASSEVYLVCEGHLTAPVTVGDQLTVEIEAIGDEGDGIATVGSFTLFVPDTEVGETVEVEVTDIKPNFGFATLME